MLNGRPKGESSGSLHTLRPIHFQPRTSSPVRRSRSNAQFSQVRATAPDLKTFQPIKLSLSPRKKTSESGKELRISAKPSNDWGNQPTAVTELELFEREIGQESAAFPFSKEVRMAEKAVAIPAAEPLIEPTQAFAPKSPLQQQHSNASSKAHLRTSMETALSGLTPRLLAQLPVKPPAPEAERVYHTFVNLLNAMETGAAPEPFQFAQHKAWKTMKKIAKAPGKLISNAKLVAKAIKTATFPTDIWPNLIEDLRISAAAKTSDDEVASTLAAFMHSLATQYRAVALEKELSKQSLDYMESDEDSPRRKLLQSLINRSGEGKDKIKLAPQGKYVPAEEQKRDVSPVNPFPLAAFQGETPSKPNLRHADSPVIPLNLSKLRTKSPDTQSNPKTTPKTTPRKRVPPSSTDRDPLPEANTQFSSLLFDVKFSVFLKEKLSVPSGYLLETDEEMSALRGEFRTWVKHTDASVGDVDLERFLGSVDREKVLKWQKKLGGAIVPREQTPTWMQMSLRRDKAKLAIDIRPVGKK